MSWRKTTRPPDFTATARVARFFLVCRVARGVLRGCWARRPHRRHTHQPPQHASAVRRAKYTLSLLFTAGEGRWKTSVSGLFSPFQDMCVTRPWLLKWPSDRHLGLQGKESRPRGDLHNTPGPGCGRGSQVEVLLLRQRKGKLGRRNREGTEPKVPVTRAQGQSTIQEPEEQSTRS